MTTVISTRTLDGSMLDYQDNEDNDDTFLPAPSNWFPQSQATRIAQPPPTSRSHYQSYLSNHGEHENHELSHEAQSMAEIQPLIAVPYRPDPPLMDAAAAAATSDMPSPQRAPSLTEISSHLLPKAASELLTNSMRTTLYTLRLGVAKTQWQKRYTDLGSSSGWTNTQTGQLQFSSLKWNDRQLVQEWRTMGATGDEDDDGMFQNAKSLVPPELPKPPFENKLFCKCCKQPFGPALLRHHCRNCGGSFCHLHSRLTHNLPQYGYLVPERVCDDCKGELLEQALAERVAWRLARLRDYNNGNLTPYFEVGVDTVEDAALRVTRAAIELARKVPLGAQAHVAVETVEVLRKHGLKGIYGLILRKEFLAAADLLCRACGINKKTWPLSVHELSAAIFYALAQHRAMRGMYPEREHLIHTIRRQETTAAEATEPEEEEEDKEEDNSQSDVELTSSILVDETDNFNPASASVADLIALADAAVAEESFLSTSGNLKAESLPCDPVCGAVPDSVLQSCLFYAPIALNFIYAECEVDMQLLCAQQGWRLLYSHLEQEPGADRPASALLVHPEQNIACFAIRGTATINDVVTDIRQMPLPFPEEDDQNNEDWTNLSEGQGLAVCGMARAAYNLFREHIDVLVSLVHQGYRIRICGHSLGAGVSTLLGCLVLRQFETSAGLGNSTVDGKTFVRENDLLRVYGYGPPSCVDERLSSFVQSFVTTVVLHDDVIPRLTPTSIRGLLKHLLHIRETWVKAHLQEDLTAITDRARTVWAPRWKSGFTLGDIARKQYQYGKRKLLSVKGNLKRKMSSIKQQESKMSLLSDEDRDCAAAAAAADSVDVRHVPDEKRKDCGIFLDDSFEDAMEGDGTPGTPTRPIVDMLGGIDKRIQGIVVDGEEFFDADNDLLEDESAEFEEAFDHETEEAMENEIKNFGLTIAEDDSWANFDEQPTTPMRQTATPLDDALEENDDHAAVMLDETPLPRMFLPGKIIHIYTHRGGYKAAFAPMKFRELRRVSLAANMLTDHTCRAYYEALLEVQTVRQAPEGLPQWTAFDEDDTCSCCASLFTWASTSDSEAQSARDKHNCRSCGTLVCDPCSKNRIPLPSVGITVPVRVCDRCYNDMGGVLTGGSGIELNEASTREAAPRDISAREQRQRHRERRSTVVDDLASRLQTTVTSAI